jgi:predicted AAA+ superfamily ATPase
MIDLSPFFSIQKNLLKHVPMENQRYLYERINWKNRLIGLIGGRGTGKTTLLLQYLVKQGSDPTKHLYISADNIRVEAIGIYEIASQFFRMGGKLIIIDEVHKYDRWPQEIKNIYDSFPAAGILFSGSSTLGLQLGKADLSRRAVFYTLPGLSFREYLLLAGKIKFPVISFSDLLKEHTKLTSQVLAEGPILGHFRDYLEYGVYPFFLEGIEEYLAKVRNIIEKILYEDIVSTSKIKSSNISALKRILWLIATSQPFEPNLENISKNLGVSKPILYRYLDYLERAGLLSCIMPEGARFKLVRKPAKIYIENTNLLRATAGELSREDPVGSVRETFVQHQLISAGFQVRIPQRGDFLVEDKYLLEAGGRHKGKKQIEGQENAYIVKDDIDVGFGNIIPMWAFGFLY